MTSNTKKTNQMSDADSRVQTMGNSPAYLTNRTKDPSNPWCRKPNIEYDPCCDPDNPKDIQYKQVLKAAAAIKGFIDKTPLTFCKQSEKYEMDLYYKLELFHRTSSFKERGALYSLLKLTERQKQTGVITASTGNWGLALAYHCRSLSIPVTVVYSATTSLQVVEKCRDFGATVFLQGDSLAEAKHQAFVIATEKDLLYINGYDHPHVIAASGSIGLEILEDLPDVNAIIVPVGGGALIAGIAAAVKHLKPEVLIYGVESNNTCNFFKALDNEKPYKTNVTTPGLAHSLAVPMVGCNSFYTARSLIDKMVLVDEDTIARSILFLAEEEKMIVEGAGAISLAALMSFPNILPELFEKKVCCILTGGNVDIVTLPDIVKRARVVDGRLIKLKINMVIPKEESRLHSKVMSMIENVGANVLEWRTEPAWQEEDQYEMVDVIVVCETRNLDHACTLRRVMTRLFPGMCEFEEEPFMPAPKCICFPNRYP